ncbi:MAG: hypothetical protein AAFV53_27390 [Myxococcota bacterium]
MKHQIDQLKDLNRRDLLQGQIDIPFRIVEDGDALTVGWLAHQGFEPWHLMVLLMGVGGIATSVLPFAVLLSSGGSFVALFSLIITSMIGAVVMLRWVARLWFPYRPEELSRAYYRVHLRPGTMRLEGPQNKVQDVLAEDVESIHVGPDGRLQIRDCFGFVHDLFIQACTPRQRSALADLLDAWHNAPQPQPQLARDVDQDALRQLQALRQQT